MKTKINFLMVLALLVILVGASAEVAAAQSVVITIGPDTLPDGAYATRYSQQLSADGGTAPYTFSVASGSALPSGLILGSGGLLSGYAYETPGSYLFSITVTDYTGVTATREFTLVIAKGMTYVHNFRAPTATWGHSFGASVEVDTADGLLATDGEVAFSVDGTVVPGCAAVVFESVQGWRCLSMPSDLSVGSHTVKAAFTPNPASADLLNPAEAELTIEVVAGSYFLKGFIYNDANKNGFYDDPAGLAGWTVNLDEGCDATIDLTATTASNGWFSFYNIAGAQCIRITEVLPPGWQQTTPVLPDIILSQDQNALMIGNWYPTISLSPNILPTGTVGEFYSQQMSVDGGTAPYTFSWSVGEGSLLPPGLTLSEAGLISGTPTQPGTYGSISIRISDVNGAVVNYYNYTINILSPITDGTFNLTSSLNPSPLGDAVTFTFSGAGEAVFPGYGTIPPVGYVEFTDNGTSIADCPQQLLNINMEIGATGDYPATCTISALAAGPHTIQAVYTDLYDLYNDATLTLEQQIGPTISISPDPLPNAVYDTAYSQQLTASGGAAPYTFVLASGALPSGITLQGNGLLSGRVTNSLPGNYPITIRVTDANSVTATRDYTFVLEKATPSIEEHVWGGGMEAGNLTWNKPFDLWAYVTLDLGNGSFIYPPGTVAFSIDGNPVPGCEAVTLSDSIAACRGISMALSIGSHTFQADYSPTGYEGYYYPVASSSGTFTVDPGSYYIWGYVFLDENKDGVMDPDNEFWPENWTFNLTTCAGNPVVGTDGNIIGPQVTGWSGWFQFTNIPGGQCVRVSEEVQPGWQTTTDTYNEFTLSSNVYPVYFGVYYPTITISGPDGGLPYGSVGVPYTSQLFSATGGEGPYTFTMTSFFGHLPDGLTLSTEGTLSGTPTLAGSFQLTVQAEDANHAIGSISYVLGIMADGTFTLTSSSNPSTPGEAVTFTLSGTGEAFDYYTSQKRPPYGQVTFQADGVDIQGCINVDLSYGDEYGYVYEQPAVCTTSALGVGTHEIKAIYTDWTGYFHNATVTLEQVVNPAISADLSITKTDRKDPVKPGARLVYTLMVSNTGPNAAESITLQDTLDKDTTYVSVSAPSGWTCKYASGKIICTSASLASGSSATIQITVTVNKTAKVGKELVNNAMISSVTYDPMMTNNSVVQKTLIAK